MTPPFDWNAIPLILALARTGNKSAAARAMGVDGSTVGRRIAAAERALKVRLFTRDTTTWRLTDAGRVFTEQGVAVDGAVRSMVLATVGEAGAMGGTVRVSTIDFLFDYWLAAHLPALGATHPGLTVQLQGGNDNLSFIRQEADLALRLARPDHDAALLMRRLGTLGFAVYTSADAPCVPAAEWGAQPWLTYGAPLAHLPEMRWIAQNVPHAQCALQVDSLSTMARACRAGVGLALLPCLLGDGAREGLRCCSTAPVLQRDLWLLRHRDSGAIARFEFVAAWLAHRYAADAARLRGA